MPQRVISDAISVASCIIVLKDGIPTHLSQMQYNKRAQDFVNVSTTVQDILSNYQFSPAFDIDTFPVVSSQIFFTSSTPNPDTLVDLA